MDIAPALYLVVDPRRLRDRAASTIRAAVEGGAEWIQIRMKGASTAEVARAVMELRAGLGAERAALLVNDDVEAALLAGADGVHVGQDDLPAERARERLGRSRLLGVSTHSRAEVERACAAGADYVGFGAMFASRTRPEALVIGPDALSSLDGVPGIPVYAIGGIDLGNLDVLLERGVRRVAVSSAILDAPDPRAAAEAFRARLP